MIKFRAQSMLAIGIFCGLAGAQGLVHPGGWHTAADIARIRKAVGAGQEPVKSASARLLGSGPRADFRPSPLATVSRGTDNTGNANLAGNASQAYALMIKWVATNDLAYADAAIRVLDGWSGIFTRFTGTDARLGAGIYGNLFAQAAELAAYARPLWPNKARAQSMFRNVFLPLIVNFSQEQKPNGNWESAAISGVISMAVFLDDTVLFNGAVLYLQAGAGNGSINHYIINAQGQCQESGRDQPHAMGGIGHIVEAAETAWNQGVDLYSFNDKRLLAGLEYAAKYNLGNTVPFASHCDIYGKYCATSISPINRGQFSPIWEMAYNAYRRMGIAAPYSKQVRDRPGYAPETGNNDHPGFGTLTFNGATGSTVIVRPGGTGLIDGRGAASSPIASTQAGSGRIRNGSGRVYVEMGTLSAATFTIADVRGRILFNHLSSATGETPALPR